MANLKMNQAFLTNQAAGTNTTALIPPSYNSSQLGSIIEFVPLSDEFGPKKGKQYWNSELYTFPRVETQAPQRAASNAAQGVYNNVWEIQHTVYSPINYQIMQLNIAFQLSSYIYDGNGTPTEAVCSISEASSFIAWLNSCNYFVEANTTKPVYQPCGDNVNDKTLLFNCPQSGLFPLFSSFEVKTGTGSISVATNQQDQTLLYQFGACILRNIEHDYSLVVPWFELWNFHDNITNVKSSFPYPGATFASTSIFTQNLVNMPAWSYAYPNSTISKIKSKYSQTWLNARASWIMSIFDSQWRKLQQQTTVDVSKWFDDTGTPAPAFTMDVACPVSLFCNFFEQPPDFLSVNDTFRYDVKYNNVPTVRYAWGSQICVLATPNPGNNAWNAIVNNTIEPIESLRGSLSQAYSSTTQYFQYYQWKGAIDTRVLAGNTQVSIDFTKIECMPDYIMIFFTNLESTKPTLRGQYGMYQNDATKPWTKYYAWNNNNAPIIVRNCRMTAYGIGVDFYRDSGIYFEQDGQPKAYDFAYNKVREDFWNNIMNIQKKGSFNNVWGDDNTLILPTSAGMYDKIDGDLFKPRDKGPGGAKIDLTYYFAPQYMQGQSTATPTQRIDANPMNTNMTIKVILVYPSVAQITPAKNLTIYTPPAYPIDNTRSATNTRTEAPPVGVGDIASNSG